MMNGLSRICDGIRYQIATAARVAEYLQRSECYGPALEADDLEEASRLLGSRPRDWREADAQYRGAIRLFDESLFLCLGKRIRFYQLFLSTVIG